MGMDESVVYTCTGHCVCAWLVTHYKVCPCEIFEERVRTCVLCMIQSFAFDGWDRSLFPRLFSGWHTFPFRSDTHGVVKQVAGPVVGEWRHGGR